MHVPGRASVSEGWYAAGVIHRPLQETLTLPVEGRREVRAACNPSRPLIPEEQVLLHEDLSIVQAGTGSRRSRAGSATRGEICMSASW
jgi:hypothetical protein